MSTPTTTRERPILFTGAMVRALLAGTKTQTRRLVKPQPSEDWIPATWGEIHQMRDGEFVMRHDEPVVIGHGPSDAEGMEAYPCRYGVAGDRLWVRERSRRIGAVVGADDRPVSIDVQYEADGATRLAVPFPERLKPVEHGRRLSMGCYREASRLTLEITDVRVQRLQEISEEDAYAEGVDGRCVNCGKPSRDGGCGCPDPCPLPRDSYLLLWESINGAGSWDANPWVWAISFRKVA